jgi:hypothetical protein
MAELEHWDSFCVIVGSAAGALIGLQFVVLTLIAEHPPVDTRAGFAFASPTIVHFSAVLLVTVLMRVPWHALTTVAALWALLGFIGVVYVLVVMRRMRTQKAYRPDLEDWIFHGVLPIAGYGTLATSALVMPSHESSSREPGAGRAEGADPLPGPLPKGEGELGVYRVALSACMQSCSAPKSGPSSARISHSTFHSSPWTRRKRWVSSRAAAIDGASRTA